MNEGAHKVVSIRGGEIVIPGVPHPAVIEALEQALEAARSGEIVGVAAVFTHSDHMTSSTSQGNYNRQTLGLLECMKADICDKLREESRS